VTILSLWWWAITAVGVVCILGVTSRYGDIATAQNNADAIALAYASRDSAAAQKLADALHVTIEQATTKGPVVTVTIRSGSLTATAQASL
jgi:membrane-bound lytic murein transglycosylase B